MPDAVSDPDLAAVEKEVTLRTSNAEDTWTVYSANRTVTQYLLDHPAAEVLWTRTNADLENTACKARIPLGLVGLKAKPPKRNQMSAVVSSGELRDREDGGGE